MKIQWRTEYLHSLKVSAQGIPITCKEKNGNFTLENPDTHHHNSWFKGNLHITRCYNICAFWCVALRSTVSDPWYACPLLIHNLPQPCKKKKTTISSAAGDVVKSEFLCITGGSTNWHHHFEILFGNYLFIQLYIHLPYDPVVPCPGIHPREMKTCAHTKTCTEAFIMGLFVIGRTTQISTNWWVGKQIVVHPHNRIYSAMKRNKLRIYQNESV